MRVFWFLGTILALLLAVSCVPVRTEEKTIVLSSEDGVIIVDVSNPENSTRIGGFDIPQDLLVSFDVQNSVVYAAHGEGGITVIDFSDPENPEVLGKINTYNARDIQVVGDVAYVADLNNGVLIVDVSDPGNSQILSNISGFALHVRYQDGTLFSMNFNTLEIFNVSDPENPEKTTSMDVNYPTWVYESEGVLYVLTQSALMIYDLSDPSNPVLLSKEDLAFISNPREGVFEDDKIYTWNTDEILVLDVSDAEDPKKIDEFDPRVGMISGVYKVGNLLYVVGDGLSILDLESGETIGRYEISKGDVRAVALWIDESNVFTGFYRLDVFDVSHPSSPEVIGSYEEEGVYFWSIFAMNGYLYGACNQSELEVLDVSDPEFPAHVRTVELERPVSFVLGTSDVVYASGNQEFVSLDPDTFQILDEKFVSGNAMNFQIAGDRVFLNTGSKIYVLNVSDPSNLSFIGDFTPSAYTYSMAYRNGYLYLAAQNGVIVVDVSNPGNPIEVKTLELENAKGMWVEDDRLYITRKDRGITVVSITNPESPWVMGEFDTDGDAISIMIFENKAYVADGFNGLVILDVSDPSDIELLYENDVNAYHYTGIQGM